MPDFSLSNSVTLIVGRSGTGKTSLSISLLLNFPAACKFIFDWKEGEISSRLKKSLARTERDCELSLPTGFVCFYPDPGRRFEMLRWFGEWSTKVSQRGPGAKIFYIDEYWKFTDGRGNPPEIVEDIVRGVHRPHGVQFVSSTQHPRDYNRDVRAEVTEWILFNTTEPGDLDAVRPYWTGVDAAAKLPKGHFLAYNRDSGGIVAGAMEPGWPPGKFRELKLSPSV